MSSASGDSVSRVSAARARIGTTYVDEHDNEPAAILTPQGLGDSRGPDADTSASPSTFDRLLDLPNDLLMQGELLRDLRNVVTEALERTLWVSDAELINVQGTTGTFGGVAVAYAIGFSARVGAGVALRHLQVGSDTAGVIVLYATRGTTPDPTGAGLRPLGAVRTTTTALTAYPALEPLLDSGENLLVVLQAASGKLDFSCEYHTLRSGR